MCVFFDAGTEIQIVCLNFDFKKWLRIYTPVSELADHEI